MRLRNVRERAEQHPPSPPTQISEGVLSNIRPYSEGEPTQFPILPHPPDHTIKERNGAIDNNNTLYALCF